MAHLISAQQGIWFFGSSKAKKKLFSSFFLTRTSDEKNSRRLATQEKAFIVYKQ